MPRLQYQTLRDGLLRPAMGAGLIEALKVLRSGVLLEEAYKLEPTRSKVLMDAMRPGLLLRSTGSDFLEQGWAGQSVLRGTAFWEHNDTDASRNSISGASDVSKQYGSSDGPSKGSIRDKAVNLDLLERLAGMRRANCWRSGWEYSV